jgi:hypothetical protein
MHPFFDQVIRPLLNAAHPRTVVEIGAERGLTTTRLLAWAAPAGATVHSIDPSPRFDVARAELEYGDRLRFHRDRSLAALERIGAVDAALIDGDHNWHTVSSELAALGEAAAAAQQPLPLVIAHDAGWPYGRRDMYYDPQSIPVEHRHDAARAGIAPGRSELGSPGINAGLWNATHEGGPRNGVLTAIEDFVAGYGEPCELIVIEGWHGLAVLSSRPRLAASPPLAAEFERLRSPEFLRAWLGSIELARIGAENRAGAAREAEARALRRASGLEQRLLDEPEAADGESTLGGG